MLKILLPTRQLPIIPKANAALVLGEMITLLEERGKSWSPVRGLALDKAGRKADPVYENATAFSIEGAMHAAAARCGEPLDDTALESVRQRIYMCLPRRWQRTNYDFYDLVIQAWEAYIMRSHAEVIKLLRDARASARALAERPKVF